MDSIALYQHKNPEFIEAQEIIARGGKHKTVLGRLFDAALNGNEHAERVVWRALEAEGMIPPNCTWLKAPEVLSMIRRVK